MTPEEMRAELLRRQLEARQAELGFPTPQGGSSVNPEAVSDLRGNLGAAGRGALQGASFGLSDELYGLMGAVDPNNTYSDALGDARYQLDVDRAERPGSAVAGEVIGGGATGLLTASATAPRVGAGLLARMLHGGAVGGAEGAAYGFNAGEGGFGPRVQDAAMGAGLGAGIGAAIPGVVGALAGARRSVTNPIAGAMNIGNDARANNAAVRAYLAANGNIDDIGADLAEAAAEGQGVYTVADALGTEGQRALAGAVSQPGPARPLAHGFLNQRQLDQGDRLGGFLREHLGADQTAAASTAAQTAARGQAADVAYDAARQGAGPVDVRGALSAIDDRIGPMDGSGVAGDGIDARLSAFRNRLASANPETMGDGVTAVELADFDRVLGVKQDLQDAIGAAVRAGRDNEARELGRIMRELDSALEASSPNYRAANDGFRDDSRAIDAVGAGQAANRPGQRAEDVLAQWQGMNPREQASFRTGYADRILGQIESATPNRNMALPLTSGRQQAVLGEIAENPEMLARRIDRENTMAGTRNEATGGSRTAELLADQDMVDGADIGIISSLTSGNYGAAAGQILGRTLNAARGNNEGTREALARILLSGDTEALSNALQGAQRQSSRRGVVEALLRGGGRSGAISEF